MDAEFIPEIQRVLPELDNDSLDALVSHLMFVVGVREKKHLAFLEIGDLQNHLTPIQYRQIINAFKPRERNDSATNESARPPTAPSPDTSLVEEPSPTALRMTATSLTTQNTWTDNFHIPWDKMPATLSRSMSRGERANPPDRRAMVRKVVDAMRELCPNPNRAACVEVAKTIVSKYPLTFTDRTVDGEQLGIGYYSLVNQLKTRIEQWNRNNTSDRIRKPKATAENSTATKTVRCKTDSYGCINWQPKSLPEGENVESLEERRTNLKTIFQSVGPRAVELPDVTKCMALTYIYQRHMINTCPPPSVLDIEEQWPFLFTNRGLCSHFNTLTGIEITERLGEALKNKGTRIINYFKKQTENRNIQALLRETESAIATSAMPSNQTGIGAILLLMKHFHENEDSIFILADACATSVSVQNDMDLPVTPRLIMLGNTLLTAAKWMISIEGKVTFVLEEHLNFAEALSVFFSSFFVFNIEYQEPACATLEFIQRFFVRINPEAGTKCTSKTGVSRRTGALVKRKIELINSRVSSFLRQLTEFEWKNSN